MKRGILSPPALACLLTALVLAVLALGQFMRETDQAWLLDGGMGIANGHPEIARAEFNFDKQFITYYLAGELFKFLPRPFNGDELVLAANILGMIFFWGAMCLLLARSAHRISLALTLPVILAPAFLVYSPFYASAFISAGFVMLLADFLSCKHRGWPLYPVSFLLTFLAVGARADAIFLLPLLAVLHSSRSTFAGILKSPDTWLLPAGGLAAFFWGRTTYLTDAVDYVSFSLHLKQLLAYIVFGLGGAALVLLAALLATARATRNSLWAVALFGALALPMGYYSLQLLSPRHCAVGAVSVLLFICARRGQAIFKTFFRNRLLGFTTKFIFVATAVVPVFLGLDLADLHHPKITFKQPTLLPSVAGVAPAGAYLAFAQSVRTSDGFLDHNQAVWSAAKSARFVPDADGTVPYLFSPIESYLKFAIRLQNKVPHRYSLGSGPCPPRFFMESRSLMRFGYTYPPQNADMEDFLAHTRFLQSTELEWHGITLLGCVTNAFTVTDDFNAALWALNERFGRNEFRLESVRALQKVPEAWAGKTLVLASRGHFSVPENIAGVRDTLHGRFFGDWYICEIRALKAGQTIPLTAATAKVFCGVGAFPEWMSLPPANAKDNL